MQTVLLLLIRMKKESTTFQINANGGILCMMSCFLLFSVFMTHNIRTKKINKKQKVNLSPGKGANHLLLASLHVF